MVLIACDSLSTLIVEICINESPQLFAGYKHAMSLLNY